MDSSQVDAYLARIGAARPNVPTSAALRDLHLRHLRAVPFENLAIHLGEDIVLAEKALYTKIVEARRGGFCYELNGAFAALLTALGYRVVQISARVFVADGGLGPPYDHMPLRVVTADDPDDPWLVDVGFGRHSHFPLRYDSRVDQPDPGGTFRIAEASGSYDDLDVLRDGEPVYRFERRARELADFGATCWYQRTSPRSHFTQSLICSRLTEDGRITLSGDRLIDTDEDGGGRSERTLSEDELLPAYREHFGITIDRIPTVSAR